MQVSQFFDPNRFGLFLKRQLIVNNRTWFIEFGSLAGLLLLLTILQWVFSFDYSSGIFQQIAVIIYVVAGIALTSKTFSELRNPGKSILYMDWPASVFEKFLTHWSIRAIGYTIAFFLITFLMSIICGLLSQTIVGANWEVWNPASLANLKLAGHFIIWQSVFLFGAVYFKSNNLLKTIFAIVGISLILSFWSSFVTFGLFELYDLNPTQIQMTFGSDQPNSESLPGLLSIGETMATVLYIAIAPFFWLVTYFHIKEREF